MTEAVILRNKGRKMFSDKWDGKTYTIPPGKIKAVPVAAAKHWLGDWDLKGPDLAADKRRALGRNGELPNLEIVSDEGESSEGKDETKGQE